MPRLRRASRVEYVPELRQLAELAWLMSDHPGPMDPQWAEQREAARERAWHALSASQRASVGIPNPVMLARAQADTARREAAILAGEPVDA